MGRGHVAEAQQGVDPTCRRGVTGVDRREAGTPLRFFLGAWRSAIG